MGVDVAVKHLVDGIDGCICIEDRKAHSTSIDENPSQVGAEDVFETSIVIDDHREAVATVFDMTKAAERVGMNRVSWYDIENGANPNPTAKTLEKIAAALGVTVADLWIDEDGKIVTS